MIDLATPASVYIVNIAGKAMSAIAEILVAMGHHVSGYDPKELPVLERLRSIGITVTTGDNFCLPSDVDVVAYSTATPADHPLLITARQRGLATVGRPALQGAIAHTRPTIAVSGTHGKTTTTAMLVHILMVAGTNPSYMVGGDFGRASGGAAWCDGEWLVIEADESDGTFLRLGAQHVLVTNVDADHLDFYGSRQGLEDAFAKFLADAPGTKVVGCDSPIAYKLAKAVGAICYGTLADADVLVDDVVIEGTTTSFRVSFADHATVAVTIPEPGLHNALNATGALVAAKLAGVEPEVAAAALASYPGVSRRFERRGHSGGVEVVDDYAHNPGKVRAVVQAAARGGWGRVVVLFQPHRFSRTAALWQEFGDSFVGADVVVVTGIDAAGEPAVPGVTGELIVKAIQNSNPQLEVYSIEGEADLLPAMLDILRPGDLCLTLGAGSITYFGDVLLAGLEAG